MNKKCACVGINKKCNWSKFGIIYYNCSLKPEEVPNCKLGTGELILLDDGAYLKTKVITEK